MQHVNMLMRSVVNKREKYFKEKLADYRGNARATYNVANQLSDKFLGKIHSPITSNAHACQFADYILLSAKIEPI